IKLWSIKSRTIGISKCVIQKVEEEYRSAQWTYSANLSPSSQQPNLQITTARILKPYLKAQLC
ncbi:hypothetical protein, partial [Porphyromonas sp.]|uniref:hypothetical protein n=1 Tax=Porphyromonas sp. TaxID=1924944 RepID=UPI002580E71F